MKTHSERVTSVGFRVGVAGKAGSRSRQRKSVGIAVASLCIMAVLLMAIGEPLTSLAEGIGLIGSPGNLISNEEIEETSAADSASLAVPSLYQNPELPTGCEAVALTDVLLFWGFELGKTSIVDSWLPLSQTDFVYSFLGDPYDSTAHSCMAPCITRTANAYLSAQTSDLVAYDLSGSSCAALLEEVSQGHPVIVWSTIGLQDAGIPYARQWADGVWYDLFAVSHCVVLSGYDLVDGTVTLADPLEGTVVCDISVFAQRYEQLGSQAVVIF